MWHVLESSLRSDWIELYSTDRSLSYRGKERAISVTEMSQKAAEVGKKWYQSKRIPLYVVVGGGLASKLFHIKE